ncbi:hypothetical protein GVX81_06400 [[Haemophilus] felis]|uniref:Sel1 repeat family protein n=1 Tax=[Haemophilus] felis TaxID=123822 RepID=A0A1T0B8S4_9PAST|nr:hypothetical protein [[Haemophilus] felis]NBI40807.1 hypothetical protein [[Haemophilus] felis]OOS06161.1 hypothetical protein B0188_02830 [[Haemophilus] felis]
MTSLIRYIWLLCCLSLASAAAFSQFEQNDKQDLIQRYIDDAEAGYVFAQVNMAKIHIRHKDYYEGAKWLRKAAEQKDNEARLGLAKLYFNGWGVEKNLEQAKYWLNLVEEDGEFGFRFLAEAEFLKASLLLEEPDAANNPSIQQEAERLLTFAVEHNSAAAQAALGEYYLQGSNGFKQDPVQGCALLEKASQSIYPSANFFLGRCYAEGLGNVKIDKPKALALFELAAKQGEWAGANNAGLMLLAGDGVPENPEKALQWFQLSANEKNTEAMMILAHTYREGKKVTLNYKLAEYWALEAAKVEPENIAAITLLAELYIHLKSGLQDFSKAKYWLEKGVKLQDPASAFGLAWLNYHHNLSGDNSLAEAKFWATKAVAWGRKDAQTILDAINANENPFKPYATLKDLQTAAQKGNADAQFTLANFYIEGKHLNKDPKKAFQFMQKAAKQHFTAAFDKLGLFYMNGFGVKKDLKQALNWFKKSALSGDAQGQYHLASIYLDGIGVKRNKDKALEWFKKAAEQNLASAQLELARLYLDNDSPKKDIEAGLYWLTKSAEQNDPESIKWLSHIYFYGGGGVEQNNELAKKWLKQIFPDDKQAVAQLTMIAIQEENYDDAFDYLQPLLETKLIYKPSGQTELREFVQQHFLRWLEKPAHQEQYHFILGELYLSFNNINKAIYHYTKAAEQGYHIAHFYLVFIYGMSDPRHKVNIDKIFFHLEKAAQAKIVEAQYLLAQLYSSDDPMFSTKRNNKLALKWAKAAVQQGFLPAVELQKTLQEKVKNKKKAQK